MDFLHLAVLPDHIRPLPYVPACAQPAWSERAATLLPLRCCHASLWNYVAPLSYRAQDHLQGTSHNSCGISGHLHSDDKLLCRYRFDTCSEFLAMDIFCGRSHGSQLHSPLSTCLAPRQSSATDPAEGIDGNKSIHSSQLSSRHIFLLNGQLQQHHQIVGLNLSHLLYLVASTARSLRRICASLQRVSTLY